MDLEEVKRCKEFLADHKKELRVLQKQDREAKLSKEIREKSKTASTSQKETIKELRKEKQTKQMEITKKHIEELKTAANLEIDSLKAAYENDLLNLKLNYNKQILDVLEGQNYGVFFALIILLLSINGMQV